jgi:putative cell wall-binding protein
LIAPAAIAFVVGLASVLTPVGAASAETPQIGCPQINAAVGFPVESRMLLPEPTPNLGVHLEGALPAGLTLFSDATRAYVYGTPTAVGESVFFLRATVGVDGEPVEVSTECIMKVKPAPTITRIAGTDRYDQSARVSASTHTEAKTVYLASGEKFSDALSASSVAAVHSAPLLLTRAAQVTPSVVAEIQRLKPENVVVVGGAASVSAAVIDQLDALSGVDAKITRIAGADRFEVSRALIGHAEFGIAEADDVYVATGASFPDALGASPVAATLDAPVLLVNGSASALSPAETATLTKLGTKNATVVGGPASVSAALVSALEKSFTTTRIDGKDRFEVNANLNDASFDTADRVYLSSAVAFPDALSGGAAAGHTESPLYITNKECVAYSAYDAIGRLAPDEIIVLGGTSTLQPEVENMVRCTAD